MSKKHLQAAEQELVIARAGVDANTASAGWTFHPNLSSSNT